MLAFYLLAAEHWPKLRSTNPLERVNREIGRRSEVVGIFPNDAALLRLAGMLLIEQNDEWLVGRRYLSESSLALVTAAHHPHPATTASQGWASSLRPEQTAYADDHRSHHNTRLDYRPSARRHPLPPAKALCVIRGC